MDWEGDGREGEWEWERLVLVTNWKNGVGNDFMKTGERVFSKHELFCVQVSSIYFHPQVSNCYSHLQFDSFGISEPPGSPRSEVYIPPSHHTKEKTKELSLDNRGGCFQSCNDEEITWACTNRQHTLA